MPRAAPKHRANAESDTRERILQAALEIFSDQGFQGATTRAIADRAGVNLGLIKYYFDTKVRLWRAAVDRAFSELRATLPVPPAPVDVDSLRQQFRERTRAFVRFAAAHPEFIRLMNDESKREGPRMRWLVDRHVKPLYEHMWTLTERGRQTGALPPINPVSMHYILVGSVSLLFSQAPECRRATGQDPMSEEIVGAHADAIIRLFLGADA